MSTLRMSEVNRIVNNAFREQFKSFMHGNGVRISSVCLGASLTLNLTDIADPKILAFITGAAAANFGNSVVKAYRDSLKFAREYREELMKDTIEYQACKNAYDEYIGHIANYMRSIGVTNSLDVGMLFMELLYNGYLSVPGTFNYHKYSVDNDSCTPVMGARVASGGAVCRHIASSLSDLYNELGFTAAYVSVKGTDSKVSTYLKDKLFRVRPNHAVVMVGDLTGKYVIDPTWETVAVFRDTDEYARIIFNRKDIPYYRVDIDGTVTNGRRKDYDSYVTLRTMRPKCFVKGEIGYSQKCAIDYVAGHFLELDSLRYRLGNSMVQCAQLEQRLSGYHDVRQLEARKKTL